MTIKLYYDLMSQPSRSLYILLKTVKCNFEPKFVDLRKAEHYSDEFSKINRLQRVPVIDHDGFVLTESVAIIKYLSQEGIIPDSLYPKDSKLSARVNEFLEWQHIGLRLHTSMYFRVVKIDLLPSGKKPDEKTIASYGKRMVNAISDFDTKWLGRGHPFITGDKVTVADLFAASELEQPRMAGFEPEEKFPNIAEWFPKVRQFFNPHYEEAHIILNKIAAKSTKTAAKL